MDIEVIKERLQLPELKTYDWVELALCHPSYINDDAKGNEAESQRLRNKHKQMEYLGDFIMNTSIGDYLCRKFPEADSGKLTIISNVLKDKDCARTYAFEIGLDQDNLAQLGGSIDDVAKRGKAFGDIFEALMGAIYLSSGRNFTVAREWFYQRCTSALERLILEVEA